MPNDTERVDLDALHRLEMEAKDEGFAVLGREISEIKGTRARVKLFLESKGFGKNIKPKGVFNQPNETGE